MTPKPPAADTAAARRPVATHPMPPCRTGRSSPNEARSSSRAAVTAPLRPGRTARRRCHASSCGTDPRRSPSPSTSRDGPLRAEHRPVGAEQHLILAARVDVVDERSPASISARRRRSAMNTLSCLYAIAIISSVHGQPMWIADELELREVDRDAVERDRPADARQRADPARSQAVADLHHDRHVELAALRVERVVLRVVGRELEPVRIQVRADEAELADRLLELAEARIPRQGSMPARPRKRPGWASQ